MDFKDDISVGGQLRVGTGICPAIKEGDQKINGSALVEGPMVIGDPMAFGSNKATLMLGPNNNDDPDCDVRMVGQVLEGKGHFITPQVYVTKWKDGPYLKNEVFGQHVSSPFFENN